MDPNVVIENFRSIVTTQYIAFEGRARRRDFWYYALVYFILYVVVSLFERLLGFGSYFYSGPLTGLLELALLLPSLGLAVRRLHDTNRSGWWVVIGVIPVIGWLVLIYWYVQPGTTGANPFGTDPKAGTVTPASV
ncbi:MAG: DUF805 domain-containing protein [Rhizomicrobium sp.]